MDSEDTPTKIRRNLMVVNAVIILLTMPLSDKPTDSLKFLDLTINVNNWWFIGLMTVTWFYCNWRFVAARHGFEKELASRDAFITAFVNGKMRRYIELLAQVDPDESSRKLIKVDHCDDVSVIPDDWKTAVNVEYIYKGIPNDGSGRQSVGHADIPAGFIVGLKRQAAAYATLNRTYFTDVHVPFIMSFMAVSSVFIFRISSWFWIPVGLFAVWYQAELFLTALRAHRPPKA